MAKKSKKEVVKQKPKVSAKPIKQYEHLDKERVNNPHIGLVNMFLNRVLRSKQRLQEMVIYEILCQYYQSELKKVELVL